MGMALAGALNDVFYRSWRKKSTYLAWMDSG